MINVVVNIKSIIKFLLVFVLASALVFFAFSFFQQKDSNSVSDIQANLITDVSSTSENSSLPEIENLTDLSNNIYSDNDFSFSFLTKILDQTIPRNW